MSELSEQAREKLMRLQQLQQQLQALSMQKQSMQVQQAEISNALSELKKVKTERVYELVGNLLINKKPSVLSKSLTDKQEMINLRIESIDKQLKRITSKAQELQKEIMKSSQGGGLK